jgi:hypothetical protein
LPAVLARIGWSDASRWPQQMRPGNPDAERDMMLWIVGINRPQQARAILRMWRLGGAADEAFQAELEWLIGEREKVETGG